MPKDLQSIEDLASSPEDSQSDGESVQGKFKTTQKEIKRKEMERVTESSARQLGVNYINLYGFPVSPDALVLIDEKRAMALRVVCFFYDGKNIRLGTTNPNSKEIKQLLSKLMEKHHADGKLYMISDHGLDYALELYRTIPRVRKYVRGVEIREADLNRFSEKFTSFNDLEKLMKKVEVTDIIALIMAAAVKSRASDIHIEAEEKGIKARFRIDGVLHDAANIEKDLWKKIVSRLKLLAGVKINISDRSQDGRTSIILKHERIDIRASFLPTNYGESVVMRILQSSAVELEFENLGIRERAMAQLKRETERPNGMIITTGPTGSGKTTTLYAILKKLNNQESKIITIEDPIEYQLEGINQSQISDKYTFADGLRSIVRQDPDVIMVGEIRDIETAEIAIQAALTGHLVLSTIHTNDAAGTIPRFLSMGAKPFLIAPALNAIIGQRLVRRICNDCKTEDKPDENKLNKAKELLNSLPEKEKSNIDINKLNFYKSEGCDACQGIGYRGRTGIYEIIIMNEKLEKIILSGKVSEYEIRNIAAEQGTITMAQDGVIKALEGITSLSEVFRVAE